ncbi:MAG TPA: hypothetical protein PK668_20820 [Myxococcota bacterium]|nr:hypothetical protein [Myxococcota bacterium]HRY96645.1 hypothetical protein [Myxococcota bacterium]
MANKDMEFELALEVLSDLQREAGRHLAEALRPELATDDRAVEAGLYLECLADLQAAGAPQAADTNLPAALVRASLQALDATALVDSADRLGALLDKAVEDAAEPERLQGLEPELELHVLRRQRFTRRLEGARIALGGELAWSPGQAEAVEYFDARVRPMAWALAFANQRREGHARLSAPAARADQWWWMEGVDVRWQAVVMAEDVAELLERWPTFELHLDQLRRAARVRQGRAREADLPAGMLESLEEGRVEVLAAAGPGARPVLGPGLGVTALLLPGSQGYRLLLEPAEGVRVTGAPVIESAGGQRLTGRMQASGTWVVELGATPPAGGVLVIGLDGREVREKVDLG